MKSARSDARNGPRLYNRVAVLRVERQLRRSDLAKALDVSYQTVGYLERAEFNPSLELAFRISELFGVPIEAIFSREPFTPMSTDLYGKGEREVKARE